MKHDLLNTIEAELAGVRIARPTTIAGHRYGLVVLNAEEESLARALTPDNIALWQAISDNSVQTLAVALKSVDDVPVEQLFALADDAPKEDRDAALSDLPRWRCKQVATWLASKPGPFIRSLWTGYMGMQSDANKSLEDIRSL